MEGTAISRGRGVGSKIRTMYTPDKIQLSERYRANNMRDAMMSQRDAIYLLVFIVLLFSAKGAILEDMPSSILTAFDESASYSLSAETPTAQVFYYSRWNTTPTPLKSGSHIAGDNIIILVEWSHPDQVNESIIEVNATVVPQVISNRTTSHIVSINTRALGNNFTCLVNASALLTNGTVITELVPNVFLGNFFAPHVEILSPEPGDIWTGINNITWFGYDNNTDEVLRYEVLISQDGGTTFQLLASGLNRTWFEWNSTGFTRHGNYSVEVRATDGIYTTSAVMDGTFTAGSIIPTLTTTTTTTTITSTTVVPPLDTTAAFLAAMVATSAIMALIVYFAAKRWL